MRPASPWKGRQLPRIGFMCCLLLLFLGTVAKAQSVVPPEVLENPAAVYPDHHDQPARVLLLVTVEAEGNVKTATVLESPEADFDAAAVTAVRRWKFRPATRDGKPLAVQLRVAFDFTPPGPASPPAPPEAKAPPALESTVRQVRQAQRGVSDFQIDVGHLSVVAGQSPEKLLELAPGIFLANEGGSGHADQVFLRGFNAEQGQEIEFSVNGVPLNQVNNPDGHGYADTHFLIPELIRDLRVVEGPFDPHQGDFAVAGSAAYELGVATRGLHAKYEAGSFETQRLVAWWAPTGGRDGTFAAAQFGSTSGYGVNRAATAASAIAQYDGSLGDRGAWRLLGMAYGTHYKSAGIVRLDDVASGRVDFFGTEDPSQGGDAQRYSLSLDLRVPLDGGSLTQQVFAVFNATRILEDTTGFLLDVQEAGQSTHTQRGDGLLQSYSALTLGGRGAYRIRQPLLGHEQSLEVGYFARYDQTTPRIDRVRFGTEIPYEVAENLETGVVNLAGWVDVELRPLDWLTLRGGIRQEFFGYDVNNLCATNGLYERNQPLDVACPAYDRSGTRAPSQRATATGLVTEPKVAALVRLPADLTLTGSFGVGAQSLDARYITQDENAPVATLRAFEGGALYQKRAGDFELTARAVGYSTHVDRDLIFDPTLGRLTASTGTTRAGFVGAVRGTGRWFDEAASVTYARATFDADRTLVPYVPAWVARSTTALFAPLPWKLFDHTLQGSAGLGLSYVGQRALPFSQTAPPTVLMDLAGTLRWRWVELGVRCDNVLDARVALSQFFYASNFNSRPYPTLAPTAAITAAPPRELLFTLALHLDSETDR